MDYGILSGQEVSQHDYVIFSQLNFGDGASFPRVSKGFHKLWTIYSQGVFKRIEKFPSLIEIRAIIRADEKRGLYPKMRQLIETLGLTPTIAKRVMALQLNDPHCLEKLESLLTYPFTERIAKELSISITDDPYELHSRIQRAETIDLLEQLSVCSVQKKCLISRELPLCNGLKYLTLNAIALTFFPEEILQLHSLKTLSLDENHIGEIPSTINNLTALSSLSMRYNHLTAIPEAFFTLTQLTHLNLDGNRIQVIPAALINLTELQRLSLANNRTHTITLSSHQKTYLSALNLRGNSLPGNFFTSFPRRLHPHEEYFYTESEVETLYLIVIGSVVLRLLYS